MNVAALKWPAYVHALWVELRNVVNVFYTTDILQTGPARVPGRRSPTASTTAGRSPTTLPGAPSPGRSSESATSSTTRASPATSSTTARTCWPPTDTSIGPTSASRDTRGRSVRRTTRRSAAPVSGTFLMFFFQVSYNCEFIFSKRSTAMPTTCPRPPHTDTKLGPCEKSASKRRVRN